MEIPFKRTLPKIDLTFNKYMEFADQIYEKKTINQKQINEILRMYDIIEKFDETNLLQSTLAVENKIKEITNIEHNQKCFEQIKTIRRILKNKIKVNHYKKEYEKCMRILLVILRNKISLITNKRLTIKKKVELIKPIQTRIPKAHNQEIQEFLILQKKFNQESRDRSIAIRKQKEYDRIMAQKIHDLQLAEQLQKEERDAVFNKQKQEEDDYLLADFLQRHPSARAIRRLTRKRKSKPKRKTPKEDKKLKKQVKKETKKKNRIQKNKTYKNRQQ
tara:strand:+ start:3667 stop:4491 length:825 start_codon:yes stop_codon:yes gene_type:complete